MRAVNRMDACLSQTFAYRFPLPFTFLNKHCDQQTTKVISRRRKSTTNWSDLKSNVWLPYIISVNLKLEVFENSNLTIGSQITEFERNYFFRPQCNNIAKFWQKSKLATLSHFSKSNWYHVLTTISIKYTESETLVYP